MQQINTQKRNNNASKKKITAIILKPNLLPFPGELSPTDDFLPEGEQYATRSFRYGRD